MEYTSPTIRTSTQNPFPNSRGQGAGSKKPLANPFGAVRIQNPGEDFENLDSPAQPFPSKQAPMKTPFGHQNSYENDELEGTINLAGNGNIYQPKQGPQNPHNYNNNGSSNHGFINFGSNNQGNQGGYDPNPAPQASSLLSSVLGFSRLFGGGGNNQQERPENNEEVDFENEPPLLEDLGIDLQLIKMRTLSVLKFQKCQEEFVQEADMSGPFLLALTFGTLLLLSGKIHFGYIYGFFMVGTIGIYVIANLLSQVSKAKLYNTISILGYCLLPVVMLAVPNVFFGLANVYGFVLAALAIGWATLAATNFFQVLLALDEQKWLIAYPILLFYVIFVIITIF